MELKFFTKLLIRSEVNLLVDNRLIGA